MTTILPRTRKTIKEGTVSRDKLGPGQILTIRSGAGDTLLYDTVGMLFPGDRVYGYIVSAVWLEFHRIIRVDGAMENFHGFASTQFMDVKDVNVEPSMPGPVKTIVKTVTYYSDGTIEEIPHG